MKHTRTNAAASFYLWSISNQQCQDLLSVDSMKEMDHCQLL